MHDDHHSNGAHNDLYEKVGRIEGTLDSLDKKFDELILAFSTNRDATSARVSKIEGEMNRAKGFAAAVGALSGIITSSIRGIVHPQ